MKINSWHFLGLFCVVFGCLLVSRSTAQFTTPIWPPFTETDVEWTTPNWPPATETDEVVTQPGETTTTSGQPGVSTTPGTTTPPGSGASPEAQSDDHTGWMVTAIVFIVLTVILAILAIYLYVSMPFRRSFRPGRTFKLPRVNP